MTQVRTGEHVPQHLYRWLESTQRRIAAELDGVSGEDIKRVGLRRLRVLQLIRPEGSRQQQLAEDALISKQAIADFVDALQVDGLVERTPDPSDGRAWRVVRTPAGEQLNDELNAAIATVEVRLAQSVGSARYQDFMDVLRDLGKDQH